MYQDNANHPLILPVHFSIYLNQIQSEYGRNTFLRNVKLIYFSKQYNDADDYHSSNSQRDNARICGLQMFLVTEGEYVYYAVETKILWVTDVDVTVEGINPLKTKRRLLYLKDPVRTAQ